MKVEETKRPSLLDWLFEGTGKLKRSKYLLTSQYSESERWFDKLLREGFILAPLVLHTQGGAVMALRLCRYPIDKLQQCP